jgi:hypothetical protein
MATMPLYRYRATGLEVVNRTSLAAEQIRERQDLQRVLRQRIDVLGDDLLVVAEEYGLFEDSRRRVDLLALDREGTLVVIELKRTDDGGHMELQALRYAAMVSTMTVDHLVNTYAEANEVDVQEARQVITSWVEEPFDELPDQVRIILVSADFSTEITSTVMWLNDTYNTDISCYRIVPYRLDAEILLDLQQIIPLPEAKDFQIQQRQKGAAAAAVRSGQGGRDYTRYDLAIGGKTLTRMSKQAAVKIAIQELHRAGVSLEQIKPVTQENRWVAVHPSAGETPEDAFQREYPARSPNHLWYDLGISEGETTWVIPRFGGRHTEQILAGLASVAAPHTTLKWARSDVSPAGDEDPTAETLPRHEPL